MFCSSRAGWADPVSVKSTWQVWLRSVLLLSSLANFLVQFFHACVCSCLFPFERGSRCSEQLELLLSGLCRGLPDHGDGLPYDSMPLLHFKSAARCEGG